MAEQDCPFDVFLSYNSKDRPAVRHLAARLTAQGLKVWLDVEELPPGEPWQEALEVQINSIRAAAVIVGKDGIGPWQNQEVRAYLRKFVKDGKRVIPVLLEDCSNEPELPVFLEHFTWVDFRSEQSDEGVWRLVWGITGQKPASLFLPAHAATDATVNAASLAKTPAPSHKDDHPTTTLPATPAETRPNPTQRQNVPRGTPNPVEQAKAEAQPDTSPLASFRDTLKDGSLGPEMVIVPRGTFRMGDLNGKGSESERPVHAVNFADAFAIGRYTVTFEEYDRFVETSGQRKPNDFGWGRGRQPVVDVSWEDADEYARWLSEQTGKPYRLPSEAEWEYAARAGTETAYWWGETIGNNRANCRDSGSEWSGNRAAPVGSFPANPWGLHDTAGNIWEWVQDRRHDSYQGAPEDGSAWEQGDSAGRVLRGGSWDGYPRYARAAFRVSGGLGDRSRNVGFRLVCAVPIVGH